MNSELLEVSVRVQQVQAALAESLLQAQGALAISVLWDDDLTRPTGAEPSPDSALVEVRGLFPGAVNGQLIASVLNLLPDVGDVSFAPIADRDWERAWMDRFEPMRFGDRLWIVPTGHEPPATDADILRLDPGLAFGTGSHPSTRLCLEWIDAHDMTGGSVLDFGCGSGVLGIAAAVKGAARVQCVDGDPRAIAATRKNAVRNGVGDRVTARLAEEPSGLAADIVLANILADPLIELSAQISAAVRPSGRLVLSGILERQADGVAAAYAHRFPVMERVRIGDWVLLSGAD